MRSDQCAGTEIAKHSTESIASRHRHGDDRGSEEHYGVLQEVRGLRFHNSIIDMRRERVSSAEIAALDSACLRPLRRKVMMSLHHELTRDSHVSALWLWFAFGTLAL